MKLRRCTAGRTRHGVPSRRGIVSRDRLAKARGAKGPARNKNERTNGRRLPRPTANCRRCDHDERSRAGKPRELSRDSEMRNRRRRKTAKPERRKQKAKSCGQDGSSGPADKPDETIVLEGRQIERGGEKRSADDEQTKSAVTGQQGRPRGRIQRSRG